MEDESLIVVGETKAIAEDVKEELQEAVEEIEEVKASLSWTIDDVNSLYSRLFEIESRLVALENGDEDEVEEIIEELPLIEEAVEVKEAVQEETVIEEKEEITNVKKKKSIIGII